ncbi:MAG: T9SS type A sorting domain-containing protein [candidate division Zixibacteria bacterium]|nr:T9SS type A sorting domain-containing protein [candidate division Zixibacteria bacterium]
MLDQLVEEYGPNLSVIRYYTSGYIDPFHSYNPVEIDARIDYYDNFYSPQLFVDGIMDCGPGYPYWEDSIQVRMQAASPLEMSLIGNYEPEDRYAELDITITATDEIDFSDLRMQCALVENDIFFDAPNGVKYHSQVLRDFIPTADGEQFTISNGETLQFQRNTVIDNVLIDDSCEFVVFVQDNSTREIVQSISLKVPDMLPPPPVSVLMIPDNPPVVVPAGGSFTYTGILTNNTDQPQSTDLAVVIDVPNYGIYGPVARYNNIALTPDGFISVDNITQSVPLYAPLGLYKYYAYCGDFPQQAIDSNYFQFEVTAPRGGDAQRWETSGFPELVRNLPGTVSILNHPNPFNAKTTITYDLPQASDVNLSVYNILGQRVETLIDGYRQSGLNSITWDASEYSSGIYFYKLDTGDIVFTNRMVLLK